MDLKCYPQYNRQIVWNPTKCPLNNPFQYSDIFEEFRKKMIQERNQKLMNEKRLILEQQLLDLSISKRGLPKDEPFVLQKMKPEAKHQPKNKKSARGRNA